MKNRSIRKTINDNRYIIKTRESFWVKSVKVSDTGDSFGDGKTRYATTRDWFHRSGKSIETLIHETVNDAVCKRENKIQKEKEYSRRIKQAVSEVGKIHEEEG